MKTTATVLVILTLGVSSAEEAKVTTLMSKEPKEHPGKEATMIVVDYPPGSSDPIHRHNAYALICVLECAIVMQLKGGKQVTLSPGQTFYEGPEDEHIVGRNGARQSRHDSLWR